MTDSDVLERAAKALRDAHTGQREGSGFTRARIMTTLHHKRRGQLLRWAVLSPLATLLLVGSAWAHGAGKWPAVWQAVTSMFAAQSPEMPPKVGEAAGSARGAGSSAPAREPALNEPPESPAPLAPEEAPPPASSARATPEEPVPSEPADSKRTDPPPEPARTPPRAVVRQRVEPRRAPEASAPRSGEPPAAKKEPAEGGLEADPELAEFRRAHDLHFRGDRPREAISAYAAYMAEFPNGRFLPEARYNTALNWIKLGDKASARAALAPFADGVYGSYRRTEARQLMEALR